VIMTAGDNSLLDYQSSLAVLPAQTSGASRRNGRSENFAKQYLKYLEGSYDVGFSALLPIRRKAYCEFLLPLEIHRLGRV
jgi:hypothetical protein